MTTVPCAAPSRASSRAIVLVESTESNSRMSRPSQVVARCSSIAVADSGSGMVVLVCVLGGIGTAGVPAGSIPVVALILGMVGIPPEGIGLILGVDRFLDMCRTTLNVTGDLAAAVVVSRGESAAALAFAEPAAAAGGD